jgi:hypothetical protein
MEMALLCLTKKLIKTQYNSWPHHTSLQMDGRDITICLTMILTNLDITEIIILNITIVG